LQECATITIYSTFVLVFLFPNKPPTNTPDKLYSILRPMLAHCSLISQLLLKPTMRTSSIGVSSTRITPFMEHRCLLRDPIKISVKFPLHNRRRKHRGSSRCIFARSPRIGSRDDNHKTVFGACNNSMKKVKYFQNHPVISWTNRRYKALFRKPI
jgi:hypothetical protein